MVSLKNKEVEIDVSLRDQMMGQYKPIVSSFRDELDNYFENCEVFSTEEKLYEDIEGHDFGLLKRTAKKNNTEIFRVTSGPTKTKNALTFLEKAVTNIKRGMVIKNRLSCKGCSFYKTEHCT